MGERWKGCNVASYFITATGTDIGKTFVTAGILRAARAAGRDLRALKPVLSGYDPASAVQSDSGVLLAAMGRAVSESTIAAITPWRFAAPLSPDMAAALEGASLDFAALLAFCESAIAPAPDGLLVEGVGGVAVPLDETHLVADWIAALRLPVVLVAGTYLGTLSHSITAARFLAACGIKIAALVLSESVEAPVSATVTAAALARFIAAPIHIIPRRNNATAFTALARALV